MLSAADGTGKSISRSMVGIMPGVPRSVSATVFAGMRPGPRFDVLR